MLDGVRDGVHDGREVGDAVHDGRDEVGASDERGEFRELGVHGGRQPVGPGVGVEVGASRAGDGRSDGASEGRSCGRSCCCAVVAGRSGMGGVVAWSGVTTGTIEVGAGTGTGTPGTATICSGLSVGPGMAARVVPAPRGRLSGPVWSVCGATGAACRAAALGAGVGSNHAGTQP